MQQQTTKNDVVVGLDDLLGGHVLDREGAGAADVSYGAVRVEQAVDAVVRPAAQGVDDGPPGARAARVEEDLCLLQLLQKEEVIVKRNCIAPVLFLLKVMEKHTQLRTAKKILHPMKQVNH